MRLTQWTDYSLRVLMFCAQSESRQTAATIQEIAEQHDISKSHLTKIVQQLAARGWLETTRGRGGGMRLAVPATDLGLGAVVRATETDLILAAWATSGAWTIITLAWMPRVVQALSVETRRTAATKVSFKDGWGMVR